VPWPISALFHGGLFRFKKAPGRKDPHLFAIRIWRRQRPNDLFFFFIDSNTAAFGQRQELEKLIGLRFGEGEGLYSNANLSSLVNQVNGSGTVWAVLDPAYTRLAMQQLVPETSQFPAAAQLTSKLKP